MYENYTRQSLPNKEYRALVGSALCVFNSNTQFIIENLCVVNKNLTWYNLIDLTSGRLNKKIKEFLNEIDSDLYNEYAMLTEKRNRIIHAFQITYNNEQILATKTPNPQNIQFIISEDYLYEFIKENEKLCDRLYDVREKLKK